MKYRNEIRKLAKQLPRPTHKQILNAVGEAAAMVMRSNTVYYRGGLVFNGPREDMEMVVGLEATMSELEAFYAQAAQERRPTGLRRGRHESDWVEAYKSAHFAADLLDQVFTGKTPEHILQRLEYQANYLKGAIYRLKRRKTISGTNKHGAPHYRHHAAQAGTPAPLKKQRAKRK